MFFFENSRVVQKSTEIASRNVFHSKIDVLGILECIEKANEPWCFGCSENVTLDKDVAYLEDILNDKLLGMS